MKITVLYGGPSSERKVSLVSGAAVAEGLKSMGHEVLLADIQPSDLSCLDKPCDVVFPVLHGAWGESGELQEILEQRGLPFVGSGSRASRLGMDKSAAKQLWHAAGLPTPAYTILTPQSPPQAWQTVGLPCVVKVIDGGSSIDVYICTTAEQAEQACQTVLGKYGRAMVERFVRGKELTVGILEEQPLHPIRITTTRQFYDYTSKYEGNFTQYLFDLQLPQPLVQQIQEIARRAHQVLGCRHLSRVDFMVDEADHRPYLLEINTLPGFTAKSLLPKAARQAGIEFGPLVDRLAWLAHAQHQAQRSGQRAIA